MTDATEVNIGPVDIAVIVFEGSQFNGDVAPALLELGETGVVTILDLALVVKDDDGNITAIEVEEDGVNELFSLIAGERVDLLSEEDFVAIGEDLNPGSSALIVVWENSWVSRFASAVRGSGGFVSSYDRVPVDVLLAALAAAEEE